MPIALTSFVHQPLAVNTVQLAAVNAEITRQLLAGANFGMPGGRTRGGVNFADLVAVAAALNYAIGLQGGTPTVVTETVADLSCTGP